MAKLSYDERDSKIRKDRDKKGEQQGGTKRPISSISELTTKQITTGIISSLQKATLEEKDKDETPKTNNSAGNSFCGRESTKRA